MNLPILMAGVGKKGFGGSGPEKWYTLLRELAESLAVSRNTVSQAYKELESEGILSSARGRGTFVADTLLIMQQEGRKEKVLRIVDVAMEEAVGLGF